MKNTVSNFLGGSPLRVVLQLIVFSVIAGVVMSALNWSPRIIYEGILNFFRGIWELGFDAIYSSVEYFLLGAAVVIPVFLLIRLLSFRSPRS